MRPSLTSALLLVSLALLGLLWWSSRGEPAPLPNAAPTPTNDAPPALAPPTAALPTRAAPDAPTNARTEPPAPPTVAPAIVRGRCVDAEARPIAGVTLRLSGHAVGGPRLDAHIRDHGPIEWLDPALLVTADDGRFEFRFASPPPFQFTLNVTHPSSVPLIGGWPSLAAGSVTDLGDVTLHTGIRVTGRVVDRQGRPAPNVSLRLSASQPPRQNVLAEPSDMFDVTLTKPDGTFAIARRFRAGTYELSIGGATKVSPTTPIQLTSPTHELEIVVDVETFAVDLHGVVVDDIGAPVAGARVSSQFGGMAIAGKDGVFHIRSPLPHRPAGLFSLDVYSSDHENLFTEPRYRSGERDIRLVVRRGLDLTIRVRRADDGTPVENYKIHLHSESSGNSDDSRQRGGTTHEGGVAHVHGIRRGVYRLSITPHATTALAPEHFRAVRIDDDAMRSVDVELTPLIERRAIVVRGDDTPVVGATVELLHSSPGTSITRTTRGVDAEQWGKMFIGSAMHGKAIVVHLVTTDARGECALRGPSAVPLAARVTGPTHAPILVPTFRLDDAAPLRIVVPSGATLHGRVTPIDAIGDLRELAGLPRDAAGETTPHAHAPRVRVRSPAPGPFRTDTWPSAEGAHAFLGHPGVPIAADGTFEIVGIPPDTWDVEVSFAVPSGGTSTQVHASSMSGVAIAGLVLGDGEVREVSLDIGPLRCGRLRGVVRLDDAPFAGMIELHRQRSNANAWSATDMVRAIAGPDGRFDVVLPLGRWRAATLHNVAQFAVVACESVEAVDVVAGQVAEATFRARTAALRVRVRTPDGAPAVGVTLTLHDGGRQLRIVAPATDAEGRTTIHGFAGTFELRARIRALVDRTAFMEFNQRMITRDAAIAASTVRVTDVTLPGEEVELRLPAGW